MKMRLLILVGALILGMMGVVEGAGLRVLVVSVDEAFRAEYLGVLKKAGATVTGSAGVGEKELEDIDVVLLESRKYEGLSAEAQSALSGFAANGGGIVALGGAVATGEVNWGKRILGGGWEEGVSGRFGSRMMLYVRTDGHPIVGGASSFDLDDETVYDLGLGENIFVLGSAFTPKLTKGKKVSIRGEKVDLAKDGSGEVKASIYDIQPQMWAYEGEKHRAVVLLAGGGKGWRHGSVKAFILRGLGWVGRRENLDDWSVGGELADLRYPQGGPLRAEEAIKQWEMQPGFRASVVASEPLITKPIAIQWDARGRLWVAETPEYPNGRRPLTTEAWKEGSALVPGSYDRPARDRISILEDTDGDGVMDKKTIFHEGLELITGFCLFGDGVIVVAEPNIVRLRDRNGDGKADEAVALYGGFTPGDTHFVASHLIVAPDGWIYGGAGTGTTVTKPGTKEEVGRISGGIFRFKADGSAIQVVGSSGGNSFGAEVTSEMEIYLGKATTGRPLQHLVLPEWVLARSGGGGVPSMMNVDRGGMVKRKDLPVRAPLMQIDQVGGYSAACGSMVYEGGAWPKEYSGAIFCAEPILDIIHCERLKAVGTTMEGEPLPADGEWLRSRDYWFCPIDLSVGPDGAMYVLDFYTPVVAHSDSRGPVHGAARASVRPDREHYFGRIYRIQHENAPKWAVVDLGKATNSELIEGLKHPSRTVRFTALRILMEKGVGVGELATPELTALAAGSSYPASRILALWALARVGKLPDSLLTNAALAEDAGVRKNAFLIAESKGVRMGMKELTAALEGKEERVRLASLRAMGATALDAEGVELLMLKGGKFEDRWSKAAVAAAVSGSPRVQLEALLAGKGDGGSKEEFARGLTASLVANGDVGAILGVVGAASKSSQTGLVVVVLKELGREVPVGGGYSGGVESLRLLMGSKDRGVVLAALPLVAGWDGEGKLRDEAGKMVEELLGVVKDGGAGLEVRGGAMKSLLGARGVSAEILPALVGLLGEPLTVEFRNELIGGLAGTGDGSVGRALVARFVGMPTGSRDLAFGALMKRAEWTGWLLDALEAKKLSPSALTAAQLSRLGVHPDAGVGRRAAGILAGLGSGSRPEKEDIMAKLLPVVLGVGNVGKGKELFGMACASCHRLGGVGVEFGPNLEGIGWHPPAELLVHIIDPNRMVDDEHRTWNIKMKDGTEYSGLIGGENAVRVKLKQPGGVELELKVGEMVSRQAVGTSLMPEGFESLGAEGLRDIIGYLQSMAKKPGG